MQGEISWPRNRWALSAPESYALLYAAGGDLKQPFKLAVLELVARKALRLEKAEESGFFGAKEIAILADGPERDGPPESRPLAAVLRLHREMPGRSFPNGVTGVPVVDLAREAVKRYGSLKKFTEYEVMAALERRGLCRREEHRVLWIFPSTRWPLTTTGEAARADLEGTTRLAERNFGDWVNRDPARALAFLGVAGSSVLLVDAIHPDLQRLQEEEEAVGYTGGAYTGTTGGESDGDTLQDDTSPPDSGSTDPGSFDVGGFDFGALDFGAIGDIGGAMGSIDAGVDAGGGGGDGGGGGGDGGGGGGGG